MDADPPAPPPAPSAASHGEDPMDESDVVEAEHDHEAAPAADAPDAHDLREDDSDDSDIQDASELPPDAASARLHRLACTRCTVEHKRLKIVEPLGRVHAKLFELCEKGALTEQEFRAVSDDLQEANQKTYQAIKTTQICSLLELVCRHPMVLSVAPPPLWFNRRFFKRLIVLTKKSSRAYLRVLAKCIVDDSQIPVYYLKHFFTCTNRRPDQITRSVWVELRKKDG